MAKKSGPKLAGKPTDNKEVSCNNLVLKFCLNLGVFFSPIITPRQFYID
jgi:hypothetical protein